MFLIIESSGRVELTRRLSPSEALDCAYHAARYADQIGYPLDTENPQPVGLGCHVDVTIQRTKKAGAAVVWNSSGFYFTESEGGN